jgi:hypothetical protein
MDASVYSEAKGEYTKQLTIFIVPAFHKFFMELLQQASEEEPQVKKQLWKFQEKLSQVPEWNMDKVQKEISRLVLNIQCDYLEELITAVFIAHTKVLTAIRIGNKNKRVQITIPKLEHFLHRALSESSRLLWSSAFLFHSELSPIEKQKNHRQIEQLLHEGVAQAIRGLLPVKNILKDYLAEPETDTDADDDADEETEKPKSQGLANITTNEIVPPTENPIVAATPAAAAENPVITPSAAETPVVPPTPENTLAPPAENISSSDTEKKEDKKADNVPEEKVSVPEPVAEQQIEKIELPPIKLEEIKPIEGVDKKETPKKDTQPFVIKVDEQPEKSEETENKTPTLIVATEPTVRFTDFDQIIQRRGDKTHIDYVEKDREVAESEEFHFLDDDASSISDFEDLNEPEKLHESDFETI